MSNVGTNFVLDMFWQFCKSINVEQAVLLTQHHQINGQVETCIRFIKCMFKKCSDSGRDINMTLLQICTTLLGQGLPSPATLMFNRQVDGIMPALDCKPIAQDCDDDHHKTLIDRQQKNNNNDISPVFACIPIGSAVAVQQEDGGLWTDGRVVRTGDHNHHHKSYTIQITTNDRHITCNRQHIRPTTIMADKYLQCQSTKQANTGIDPLMEVLDNINENPMVYISAHASKQNNHNSQYNEQTSSSQKEEEKDKEQHNTVAINNK